MRIKYLLPFYLLFCFSCKQNQKVIYDPTNVSIQVRNDQGVPQQGAQVRMFNDINAYLNSKNNGEENGFVEKVFTDASGNVNFKKLDTDKEYYFLVNYRDRGRFVDLDNYDQEFKYSKFLSKGVETLAEINLKPAKSIVGFYLPENLKGFLPVKLLIGIDTIGDLSQSVTSVSGPTQKGILSFRLSPGKKQWTAVSSQGCIWFGDVNVQPTEGFTPIELKDCNGGSLSFYVGDENFNQLPIEITLNSSNNIGKLNTTSSSQVTCFDKKALSVAGPPGKYTYTAVFKRGSCVVSDTITITKGNCKIIKLPNCK